MKVNRLWNKKILVVAMLAVSTGAFADFNPFNVFSSSNSANNNSNTPSQNSQAGSADASAAATQTSTAAPAPTNATSNSATASTTAKSPYVQMQPLTAPATSTSASATPTTAPSTPASGVQINSNAQSLPANRYNAAGAATGATIGLPISGSGGQNTSGAITPPISNNTVPAGSILEALNLINKSVGSINNNLVTWKTQKDKDQVGAGAQLVPTTQDNLKSFLLSQSGFSYLLGLASINNNLITDQMRYFSGVFSAPDVANVNYTVASLLIPVSKEGLRTNLTTVGQSKSYDNVASLSNYNTFVGKFIANFSGALSQSSDADDKQIFSLIQYAVSQIAAQTKLVGTAADSQMSLLQSAVNAPFVTDTKTGKNPWFEQLQTASTPQLLRSLAILMATNNQMQYLHLQNEQAAIMLQAGQLKEAASVDQRLVQLTQAQAQTNQLLTKVLAELIAQNNKK